MIQIKNAKLGRILAIYASASFVVLQVVDLFQDRLDLPDWIFPTSLVLLIVGLPIVIMTALVQSNDFRSQLIERHFTWKRSAVVGIGAFAILALSAFGYVGSRRLGIGPAASLVSTGVLKDADQVVIAQFDGPAQDSSLATMFSEAVRISLSHSDKVRPLAPEQVREELERMKLTRTTPLKGDVAREVAVRFGAKALVNGRINRVGDSFILDLSLVSPSNGETLVAYQASARDADHLINAVDKLARRVRAKIGDSLNGMRAEPPLSRVTTSSLEALKKFSLGLRASATEGDLDKAVRLLEEAAAIDSTFAAAYVTMAGYMLNRGDPVARPKALYARGYRFRDRLTPAEQRRLDAGYAAYVLGDHVAAAEALKALFESGDSTMANNLGLELARAGRSREAEPYLRLAIERNAHFYYAYSNLHDVELNLGNIAAADSIAEMLNKALPNHPRYARLRYNSAVNREQYDSAAYWARQLIASDRVALRTEGYLRAAFLDLLLGHTRLAADGFRKAADLQVERGAPAAALFNRLDAASALAMGGNQSAARLEISTALAQFPIEKLERADRPYLALARSRFLAGDMADAAAAAQSGMRGWDPVNRHRDSVQLAIYGALATNAPDRVLSITADTTRLDYTDFLLPLRARAFEALGQRDAALTAYLQYTMRTSGNKFNFAAFYLGDTYEKLAELYEQRGDVANAKLYYAKLANLWGSGDGLPRQRAARAAARLAQLTQR